MMGALKKYQHEFGYWTFYDDNVILRQTSRDGFTFGYLTLAPSPRDNFGKRE